MRGRCAPFLHWARLQQVLKRWVTTILCSLWLSQAAAAEVYMSTEEFVANAFAGQPSPRIERLWLTTELREEAEREISKRRAPPSTPLETQTDMPLDEEVVEGINRVKRHQKPVGEQPGTIIHKEAPIHISNVVLWNAEENRRVKVGYKVEDGKKSRIDRKSGASLDNA